MAVLVWGVVLLALAAPVWAVHYLHHLPYAPECPRCRGVTDQGGHGAPLDRVLAQVAATVRRRCRRCGWAGRMRWRLAPAPSRRGGTIR